MRNIQSIRTVSSKWNRITYVNFENNRFGTITKKLETGEIIVSKLSDEEVEEAKRLAYPSVERNGKTGRMWIDWRRPATEPTQTFPGKRIADVEGPEDNAYELTAKEVVESQNRTPSEY